MAVTTVRPPNIPTWVTQLHFRRRISAVLGGAEAPSTSGDVRPRLAYRIQARCTQPISEARNPVNMVSISITVSVGTTMNQMLKTDRFRANSKRQNSMNSPNKILQQSHISQLVVLRGAAPGHKGTLSSHDEPPLPASGSYGRSANRVSRATSVPNKVVVTAGVPGGALPVALNANPPGVCPKSKRVGGNRVKLLSSRSGVINPAGLSIKLLDGPGLLRAPKVVVVEGNAERVSGRAKLNIPVPVVGASLADSEVVREASGRREYGRWLLRGALDTRPVGAGPR